MGVHDRRGVWGHRSGHGLPPAPSAEQEQGCQGECRCEEKHPRRPRILRASRRESRRVGRGHASGCGRGGPDGWPGRRGGRGRHAHRPSRGTPLADLPPGTASPRPLLMRPRRRGRLGRVRRPTLRPRRETSGLRRSCGDRRRRSRGGRSARGFRRGRGLGRRGLDSCRRRLRSGGNRRRRGGRRRCGQARRKQRQRVHVAARIVGTSRAELDVWNRRRLTSRRDRPDGLAFRDTGTHHTP